MNPPTIFMPFAISAPTLNPPIRLAAVIPPAQLKDHDIDRKLTTKPFSPLQHMPQKQPHGICSNHHLQCIRNGMLLDYVVALLVCKLLSLQGKKIRQYQYSRRGVRSKKEKTQIVAPKVTLQVGFKNSFFSRWSLDWN